MTPIANILTSLEQTITAYMAARNTPGLTLAITDRAETLHVASYGYADLAARQPITPGMLFEIGSIGKSFTALVLMQLAEAGQIDLHAPVSDYLPWFSIKSKFEPITIHHLLSHTAGITNGTDCTPSAQYEPYSLRYLETAYPPGERYYYSNVGYKALGYLLEAVTGTSYRDLLQTRILDPLGMRATQATTTHDTRRQLATGYGPLYDDQPFGRDLPQIPAPWLEYSCADGSPAMPVTDLATYARMILNQGDPLVTTTSFAQMVQPNIPMGNERSYGYGLISEKLDGRRIIGHGGGTVGFNSVMLADMDDGFGVVVMVNGICDTYHIARYTLQLLHSTTHDLPLPEPALPPDPIAIAHPETYAGTYGGQLTLTASADHLYLAYAGQQIQLEQRGSDAFYVPHPDFRRYLLRFERQDGLITAVMHGSSWYPAPTTPPSDPLPYPETWNTYPGRYRSHNPWFPNFAVVLRRGQLVLIRPEGQENILHPAGEESFQVGDTPERVRFDAIVAGKALRATYSGAECFRQNEY